MSLVDVPGLIDRPPLEKPTGSRRRTLPADSFPFFFRLRNAPRSSKQRRERVRLEFAVEALGDALARNLATKHNVYTAVDRFGSDGRRTDPRRAF